MNSTELRAWMARHRYSVRTLAAALERDKSTIQDYRSGKREIPKVIELALVGLLHSET